MPSIPIPKFVQGVNIQDFARGILIISDIAEQFSRLCDGLRNRSKPSVLTKDVRHMSVSLRSLLLENKGRLFTRMLKDGLFPTWPHVQGEILSRVVIDASPYQEIDYEIPETGEQRTLKVPGYKHGFVVNTLPGIENYEENQYVIIGNNDIWPSKETVELGEWVKQEIFEVDGLVYDLDKTIKTVADKEGAHIDQIVDSEGIYTGNLENTNSQITNDEAYIRSRLFKFGPFTYPHIVVIFVSRFLVTIARECLIRNKEQLQSIEKQFTFTQANLSDIRERVDMIMKCPRIERIAGLSLQVTTERLVMRPPIGIGLCSFEEEQARANNLPQYGETYIGIPRSSRSAGERDCEV